MVGVVTSRTRARYERPPDGPVSVNWASDQAQGLVSWVPLNQRGGTVALDFANPSTIWTLTNTPIWLDVSQPTSLALDRMSDGHGLKFASASTQYVTTASTIASAEPFTMACWYNADDSNVTALMSLGNTADDYIYAALFKLGSVFGGALRAQVQTAAANAVLAASSVATRANTWEHACGVFAAANSRTIYLNGGNSGSETTSRTLSGLNVTDLGASSAGAGGGRTRANYLNGALADARIYNRALTADDAWRLFDPATRWELYWQPARRTYVFVAAGGTTHTRSLSDTLAAQDLFARLASAARSLTDTLGLSDAYARTTTALRALSDTLATSDTFARVADASRALTDTAALADAYARTANGLRSLSDTLAAADAFARVSDANRSLPDTLALADAYSRVSDANRTLTDTAGFAEVYARVANAIRAYTEGVGLSDVFARVADAIRLFADTLALSDLATLARITPGTLQIAVADALGIANAYARTADANRAMADTLGLADALLRVTAANRLLSDSVSATDAFARTADALRLLPDALGVAEAFARQSDASRAISEATGFSEAFARQADAVRLLAESLGLADSASLSAAIIGLVLGPFYIDAACVYVAGADPAAAYVAGAQAAKGGTG